MTPEEKQAQADDRDSQIEAFYMSGNNLAKCASRFRLSRQRVLQILKARNVWKPYTRVKSDRVNFLGVNISDADKEALREEADRRGISMSALSAETIKEMLSRKEGA